LRSAYPIEDRQRTRIERIAAQLVARKGGAVEQPHAQSSAREPDGRETACGAGADDDDVEFKMQNSKCKRRV
jgi:hypothetical protein